MTNDLQPYIDRVPQDEEFAKNIENAVRRALPDVADLLLGANVHYTFSSSQSSSFGMPISTQIT